MEDRISSHFDNHPELVEDDEWKKYVLHRVKTSPVKSTQVDVLGTLDGPAPTLPSSPAPKLFGIASRFKGAFSSPSKDEPVTKENGVEKVDDEDDEDDDDDDDDEDDDDDDDDEDDEDDVEVLESDDDEEEEEVKGDEELLEEEEDKDYVPKFQFFTNAKDWAIEKWESTYDYVLDQVDETVYSVTSGSTALKKALSTPESVNYITSGVEAAFLVHNQVPIVELRYLPFLDQSILSKYSRYIDLDLPVYDFSTLVDLKFIASFLFWVFFFVVIPLIGSYYFNFVGKKHKKVRFDPLVFNVIKLISAYLFLSTAVSFDDLKNNAQVWADEHGLLEVTDFTQKIKAQVFHITVTLRLILGNVPFINGFIGLVIALYVASI